MRISSIAVFSAMAALFAGCGGNDRPPPAAPTNGEVRGEEGRENQEQWQQEQERRQREQQQEWQQQQEERQRQQEQQWQEEQDRMEEEWEDPGGMQEPGTQPPDDGLGEPRQPDQRDPGTFEEPGEQQLPGESEPGMPGEERTPGQERTPGEERTPGGTDDTTNPGGY